MAVTASTTGTARGAMQGSCRPCMRSSVGDRLRRFTERCGLEMDGVGLMATRKTIGMPELMPPSTPP